MYDVQGKTAVVTGAASGIGLGMARAFAEAGSSLVLADIEADKLAAVVEHFRTAGVAVLGIATDVTDEAQVARLADAAVDRFGGVHIAANNAGIGTGGELDRLSLDDWRWTLDVNLWGVIYGVRTFVPLLKAQGEGHITATASVAGLLAGPILGAYHVSKFGVVGLMDSLRAELAAEGSPVRASVLCPGPIDTEVTRSDRNRPAHLSPHETSAFEERFWEQLTAGLAAGMAPDRVGELVLEAVQNERFWILTHPEMHLPMLADRLAAMEADHAHRLDG